MIIPNESNLHTLEHNKIIKKKFLSTSNVSNILILKRISIHLKKVPVDKNFQKFFFQNDQHFMLISKYKLYF